MARYLIARLLYALVVIWAVSVIVFGLSRLSGDPGSVLLPPNASAEHVRQFREDLGLDQPMPVQYFKFLERALQGDLGRSIRTNEPVVPLVLERLPATLQLGGAAFLISLVFALPLGVYTATHRGSVAERAILGLTVAAQSMPVFWLGLMLILFFGVQLRWLPVAGASTPQHLIMPAVALSVYATARNVRILRSTMLEVLGNEYVRTARAKGLGERAVVWRHALRNALIPLVTLIGLQLGILLGGAIVTETVFSWPGVGRLIGDAIVFRDFPLLQAGVIFLSGVFVVANILVDLAYVALDPRIRIDR